MARKKNEIKRKNSKSKSKSRSGSKKSSGTNSIAAKSIKGPSTLYQRAYKRPYRYESNNNKNYIKKNSKSKNKMSPSKNLYKNNDSLTIKENIKKIEETKNIGYNYNLEYNKININTINDNSNKEIEKNENLNEDNKSYNKLSRLKALISQVTGKKPELKYKLKLKIYFLYYIY